MSVRFGSFWFELLWVGSGRFDSGHFGSFQFDSFWVGSGRVSLVWVRSGQVVSFWVILVGFDSDQFRYFQVNSGQVMSGQFWSFQFVRIRLCPLVRVALGLFGSVWVILGHFGSVCWVGLGWVRSLHSGLFQFRSGRIRSGCVSSGWVGLVQVGTVRVRLFHFG